MSDEQIDEVRNYLNQNPGSIRVHVWAASLPNHREMSYFPPLLANKCIEESIESKCSAKIPTAENAFNLLAYHLVYHKGYLSGISSKQSKIFDVKKTERYKLELKLLAEESGIKMGAIDLEHLDKHLSSQNLKPATDTLMKISKYNLWVRDSIKTKNTRPDSHQFYCYLVKRHVYNKHTVSQIESILENNSFNIVYSNILTSIQVLRSRLVLRGGNWNQQFSSDINKELPHDPVYLIVFSDKKYRTSSKMTSLKQFIRTKIDKRDISGIHSSDNTKETLEYLKVIDQGLYIKVLPLTSQYKPNKSIITRVMKLKSRLKYIIVDFAKKNIENLLTQ